MAAKMKYPAKGHTAREQLRKAPPIYKGTDVISFCLSKLL